MIVLHPENRNVALGEKTVIFKCEAAGAPPLEYSWKFNGEVLPEATENTLIVTNVNKKVAGIYQCCVKNKYDDVTSNPAELMILGRFAL